MTVRFMQAPLKTRSRVLFMIAVVLFVSGCAGKRELARDAYFRELDRWTRSDQVYEGLDSRLYIHATFKATSYREAYTERYSQEYELDPALATALLSRELNQAETYNEFFIAAFTPEDRWNDFHKKDSVWKLYLEDDTGAKLSPVSVTRVEAKDPSIREFFPHLDPWSYGYLVRFPKYTPAGTTPLPGPETEWMKLVATGVLGRAEMTWHFE